MSPSDETARDPQGRMLPGHSANPAGRPARKPYLRLLEAAEACGATVVVMVPTRAAPHPPARWRPSDGPPPRGARGSPGPRPGLRTAPGPTPPGPARAGGPRPRGGGYGPPPRWGRTPSTWLATEGQGVPPERFLAAAGHVNEVGAGGRGHEGQPRRVVVVPAAVRQGPSGGVADRGAGPVIGVPAHPHRGRVGDAGPEGGPEPVVVLGVEHRLPGQRLADGDG